MTNSLRDTACLAATAIAALASIAHTRQVVIDFDSMPGQGPPFSAGTPVLPQGLVNNQFLSLGVLFYSDGGGIALSRPSNAPSPPTVASATQPGPVLSYTSPVTASFWCNTVPARVDTVSIQLTSSSSPSSLEAYDLAGLLLGVDSLASFDQLSVTFPGQIHSVVIRQGPMAFDDFTFDPMPYCGPQTYCTAGTTSNACVPVIGASGTASASSNSGFMIRVNRVEGLKTGLLFYGIDNFGFAPLAWGTSSSFLCVKDPLQRTEVQGAGGTFNACDGVLTLDWNAYRATHAAALGAPFTAGQQVFAQGWFRDPPSPKGTMLSDALAFFVQP